MTRCDDGAATTGEDTGEDRGGDGDEAATTRRGGDEGG